MSKRQQLVLPARLTPWARRTRAGWLTHNTLHEPQHSHRPISSCAIAVAHLACDDHATDLTAAIASTDSTHRQETAQLNVTRNVSAAIGFEAV